MKKLALGFFSFALLHGAVEPRARRNIEREVSRAFDQTGSVRVELADRGALGVLAADFYAADVYAEGMRVERLPFRRFPRSGSKGRLRHLRLHLRDFQLSGLPVHRLEADVPFVTFDIGRAIWKDSLVFRGAGVGPGSVEVEMEGLRQFVNRKFHTILSDVLVWSQSEYVYLSGIASVLGLPNPFIASGRLQPRQGRYVDLTEVTLLIGGKQVPSAAASSLLQKLNPVLDIETDLGLKGFFTLDSVEVHEGLITIAGDITIPLASPGQTPHADR